jgi:hypothetical protein
MDDTEMYIAIASGIIIPVVLFIIGWWLTRRQKKEESGVNSITQEQSVIVNVQQPISESTTPVTENSSPLQASKTKENHPLLVKVIKVKPRECKETILNLSKGDTIEGTLQEEYGQNFDYLLLDQRNFIQFSNRDKYSFLLEGTDQNAYHIRKKVNKAGQYYLVIDLYGKKNERTVKVHIIRRNGRETSLD